MFIIIGLGNPGREYQNTRHNVGYLTVDAIADAYGIDILEKKHKAIIGKGVIDGRKVILVKPLTYMNLSGESVREVTDYYKTDPKTEILVIYDDTSMPVGQLRIRKKGSAGGHNGIKNIISHVGDVFPRIKIGIGEKPKGYDLADYVLGHFTDDEKKTLRESAKKATEAVRLILNGEIDEAMNEYNRKEKQGEAE
ncbi:MAG: aminoacyl-tRNA hydrolase [Lachnospiraceae bacterium]|nr:aminoacyl-tRNA hydrolase [Lachnospiraceae bacterium]